MTGRSDLSSRRVKLSDAKRELLEKRLRSKSSKKGMDRKHQSIHSLNRETNELPVSLSQQRLWFLDQLEPNSAAYNIFGAVRLKGVLNVTALEQSLNEIVRRHEALRTTFAAVKGEPVQVIHPPQPFPLPVVDLQSLPEAEWETEAQRLATQEAQHPFDLAQGPLLRANLLQLTETDRVLLITMHHIVSDGWSIGIFIKELTALYQAFSTGQPSPLPALPIQYADFAHWQRQWMQGEVLEEQLAYWKKQLGGELPVLELPADRPRPATQTFRGAKQSLLLSKDLSASLKSLGRAENVTLFMTMLAAFKVLLHRYTGQTDLLVGSPIAGRNRAETEGLIGFFVNNLTLRTDLSGNPSFRELLGRIREVAMEGYDHQDVSFEKLVEELQPVRDLSHSPLFQVMFAFQNMPMQHIELTGLTLSPFEVDKETSMFDLTLFVWEKEDRLRAIFEYNTDLFDTATIRRMMGHFQTLLEGIVASPDQRLSEISLLPKAEERQLLVEWNDTEMDCAQDQCLHQLFEAQVEQTPEAIAVEFAGQRLTYRELNERANQVADYLRTLGVGVDRLVGICVERSLDMVVGLLGILKSGGGYVPLDPAFPGERLAFMLADSQAPVLLTQQSLVDHIATPRGTQIVCLDRDWEVIAQQRTENLPNGARPDTLAYVIYTSGSTGKPKGVQLQHQGVVNFLMTMRHEPGLTARDVLLSVTTLSFDISVLELFLPLTTGAQVVLVSRETAADGMALQGKLAESGATVMQATPTTWRLLIDAGWPGDENLKILCGGEALPRELANQLLERCGTLWNMYGPTETTIWSTVHQLRAGGAGGVSIGRPIGNTQCYILDPHLQPVPIGVPGELHIGGDGLARGYLNRAELTAEKFIPDPFSDRPGARLYKTGDLVRYLPDGTIEFLSRIDHQIKIRGFRVELGEIESILAQHPAIHEAVVIVREDQPGDKRLVAYLIAADDEGEVSTAALRTFVREELPEYMVPSAYVFVDAFPLTPNKKIDRKALPAPDQTRPESEETFVPPRDELELELKKIWENILNVQRIGVRDNFFELGGHSLLAVRLFVQIDEVFAKTLPLVALFQAPTIEELANILRQEGWAPPSSPVVAIQSGDSSRRPFFCIPPAGSSILDYVNLVRHMEPEQPVYGLQPMNLNGAQQFMFNRVEDMAAQLIKEMQTIQPEGPYLLGGRCFGGIVAFEMARQLQAQGQHVDFLALFDTPFPNPTLSSKIKFHVTVLSQLEFKERLKYVLRKVQQRTVRITSRFTANGKHPLSPEVRELQAQAGIAVATNKYTPPVYHGKVTIFRAMDDIPSGTKNIDFGWSKVSAGGTDAQPMPGSHKTIMTEPAVQVLAEKVMMYLDGCEGAHNGFQVDR